MTTALEVCQDIPIPREVEALGRPLRVHREEGCVSGALLVFLLGVFLLLAAGTCTFIYLKVPMKKDDVVPPETMLYIAGGLGLLGFILCLGGWLKGGLGRLTSGGAYLIYPHALVWLDSGSANIIRWNEIKALVSPRALGDYHITTKDGRTFPIKHGVGDYSNLIAAVFERVKSQIVIPAWEAMDAGDTVTFGPFEVSREVIGYKGRTLPWDKVAALEIQIGQAGRRLRIRGSGSLLPLCWANLDSFPNGALLAEVIRHVCPQRLLVECRR